MESMTGYAYCDGRSPQFAYYVEIKSLNSKYNEYFINLPRALRTEENNILSLVSEEIKRGKVELNVEISEWFDERTYSINRGIVEKIISDLSEIEKKTGKAFSLDAVLSMEGAISKTRAVISDDTRKCLLQSVAEALKKMRVMRKREGKALEKDLMSSLSIIINSLAVVKKDSKNQYRKNFEKMKARIEALVGKNYDEQRLITEAAVYADKVDINEEIVRLSDHIAKFKEIAKEDASPGKRLDFLAQEMFREINTIASKCSDSALSHVCVEMKNAVDKIREQCRNII
ncbi:MAG: YicC family protein [Spirochaetes bacterium]|nr:YicC family protein [Spirochaetota bacterium]